MHYLFDIQLDAGKSFVDVQQIYQQNPGAGADDFTCDTGINETLLAGSVSAVGAGPSYQLTGSGTGWKNIDGQRLKAGDVIKITEGGNESIAVVDSVTSDSIINVTVLTGVAPVVGALLFLTFGFLSETGLNSLLFFLPNERIETIRDASDLIDTSYVVNRFFHVPSNRLRRHPS